MSDSETQAGEVDTATASQKMTLDVQIDTVGPCRKHVRVRIPREDIDFLKGEILEKYSSQVVVPGFRPGHVPQQLVERRFKKELSAEVRQHLLLQSLEQLSEDHDLDPIDEPNLDVESIEVPDEGDFEYEFEVEVRPEFDLPDYEGIEIERPTWEVTDEDVDRYMQRFLVQYGRREEVQGGAEVGDVLTLAVEFHHGDRMIRRMEDLEVSLLPTLAFNDGEVTDFDKLMVGASVGDTREADVAISQESPDLEMRDEVVRAKFTVKAVHRLLRPEVDEELLERMNVESADDLRQHVRGMLERQVTYRQRQSARQQVLTKITQSADWELPESLVRKQVENALRREVLEMQQAGFTTAEIRARESELRRNSLTSTRQALKEHFVLDKIATEENIQVQPGDIEAEINYMAFQRGENPRRVRARLTKSGLIENLEAQIRERMAVDHVLSKAKFIDVDTPLEGGFEVEAVPMNICSETADFTTAEVEADEDKPVDADE